MKKIIGLRQVFMKIIDIHAHIYPDAIAWKAAESIRDYYHIGEKMDGTPKMLLERGTAAGISQYVILPVAIKPGQVQSINNFVLSQVETHGCFVGFGTVHPGMEDIADEVTRIRDLGLRGIKIHPDCQHFDIDDPRMFPVYEEVGEQLPILMHMGDQRYTYSHPARLRHVLELFPKLRVCAAHFGGYRMYETASKLLWDKHCIMDISSSLMFMDRGLPEHYIRRYGAERMAFGTDYPVWDPVKEVQHFLDLDLTMEQKEQIAWKTASEFLRL